MWAEKVETLKHNFVGLDPLRVPNRRCGKVYTVCFSGFSFFFFLHGRSMKIIQSLQEVSDPTGFEIFIKRVLARQSQSGIC